MFCKVVEPLQCLIMFEMAAVAMGIGTEPNDSGAWGRTPVIAVAKFGVDGAPCDTGAG